jgi:hypothetical protein
VRIVAAVRPAPAPPAAPPPRFDDRLTVSLGPALFGSAAGFGPTAAPRVTIGYGRPGAVRIRVGAVGLVGGAVEVGGEGGRAALRQSLAGLDVGWTFRSGRRLQPLVFAGAGLYHARVAGEARPNYSADEGTLWAATARAGSGLALRLGARVAALLEAEAIVAEPALRVRIAGADVGRTGRPLLLLGLALAARL